jgi:hypothetical protein
MKNRKLHSYAAGGMVGQGGQPIAPGAMPTAGVTPQMPQGAQNPQMLEMEVNQFVRQHPQQVQQVAQAISLEIESGELTEPELNKIVQLATVAAQNPDMYPQVRNYAIQQGIATDQDIPQEYDQGLVFALMVAGRAIQQGAGGGAAAQEAPPKPAKGGVAIEAHEGEYVVPKHVVAMKGKEFFDKLVKQYSENPEETKSA